MHKVTTEKIPVWAMAYMEYGEEASYDLTPDEMKMADDFIAQFNGGVVIDWKYDQYFTSYPAFGLPCDVVDADIYVFN